MCLNRATRHSASSSLAPQRNKVRRWLDGWRKVRRGTLILRFLAARKAEPWTGRSGWLPWHAAPGGILLLTERLQHWQLGLASDKLPFRPRTQTSGTSQKETIMHSPGVPFRRSVLHCRREQAIAHQDSDRSDMLFSPLPCGLNGLTLFHRRARLLAANAAMSDADRAFQSPSRANAWGRISQSMSSKKVSGQP